jgi:hypothetical protein
MADGTGCLRCTDRVNAAVVRVGYRLGIPEAGVEAFVRETWVDLPAVELALNGVRPNPTSSRVLLVHFSLASGGA